MMVAINTNAGAQKIVEKSHGGEGKNSSWQEHYTETAVCEVYCSGGCL